MSDAVSTDDTQVSRLASFAAPLRSALRFIVDTALPPLCPSRRVWSTP